MTRPRDFANSLGFFRVTHYRLTTQQIYFLVDHVSGNIDVFLNGALIVAEIRDSSGLLTNFSSLDYDYQSGTASNTSGSNWIAKTTIEEKCTAIKLNFTPSTSDIISIRSY